ncbi:MFS transporter [Actinomycetospora termitidis]|uniref:MFS transporter n=1 Tax=Actinomycetospora termitidis TaxID=3053470 RepID=A0ABT7MJ76_9PSEU|nr:MFS transporter [Actinomycetospora sp. Odt1-22]MDL5159977.1 MFS transporter [Actinomycetospora sp. Odt1-22]
MVPGGSAPATRARALTGAVLLDLAVSPLFAWDVFTDSLRRDLGAGDTLLAGVFSVGLLAFMLGVLVGGRVADAVSPRRLALVALVGSVAGLLATGVATAPGVLFVTFGVLVGGSTGLGYATAVRVAGTVGTRRGLALGLVVSAYAAGTALLAPLASRLLDLLGRTSTFLVLAAVLGAVLAVAAVLVPGATPRPRHDETRSSCPAVTSPRRAVVALWLAFGLGSAPGLAAFAQAGALTGTAGSTVLAVTLINVGNFAGRLVAGPVSDRLGRRTALHLDAALLVLACLPLALGATGPVALAGLLLLGTQYGALSVLAPAATADVVPADRFGTTYGQVFTGWGLAGLTAPVGATALAAASGHATVFAAFLVVAVLVWTSVAGYARLSRPPP